MVQGGFGRGLLCWVQSPRTLGLIAAASDRVVFPTQVWRDLEFLHTFVLNQERVHGLSLLVIHVGVSPPLYSALVLILQNIPYMPS